MSVTIQRGKSKSKPVSDYIEISTAEEFNNIRNNLSGKYKIINDIDLSVFENFVPIGLTEGEPFTGEIDGQNFNISNLKIINEDDYYVALINEAYEGTLIKNIRLVNIDITAGDYTGGIIGYAENVIIENCFVSGKIVNTGGGIGGIMAECYTANSVTSCETDLNLITEDNRGWVGGIVGYGENVNIKDCTAKGYYFGGGSGIGGIVGEHSVWNLTEVLIENCHSFITIESHGSMVGGIAGKTGEGSVIKDCTNSGEIIAIYSNIGGIVGACQGEIVHCFSKSHASGSENIGGISGFGGKISKCFSSGNIRGQAKIGGIVGGGTGENITDCMSVCDMYVEALAGGIIGELSDEANTVIKNVIFAGNIFQTPNSLYNPYINGEMVEPFIGKILYNTGLSIENGYFDTDKNLANKPSTNGLGKTTAELQNSETYNTWDTETTWRLLDRIPVYNNYTQYPVLR